MSTTSAISSSTFNGSSTFSSQLQQVITHSVALASLPITQLQNTQATLTGQQTELSNLSSYFSSIQSAISSLDSATGIGSFSASAADSTIASPVISSGAMAGNYSLNVTSMGSKTNTISNNGLTTVTDPTVGNIDSSSAYTLNVNGTSYAITTSSNTLDGLAQAITNSAAQVQATVVNVGNSSSPDYRLSIQSLNYAPDTIQLNDGTNNLLKTLATGANITYQVNGQPSAGISSSSPHITLSTGLSVQLLKVGSTDITVSQSDSNLASALSSFVSSYNSIRAELNKNRGQNGGALTGQSVVYDLQNQLTSLASYSSSDGGSVNSLASLGLSFDNSGNLQFDSSTFGQAMSTSAASVLSFLGSSTSGGFIKAANTMLTSITDSSTGILTQASSSISIQLATTATKISDDQAKVSQLQTTLTNQMATVDATISSLQNQVTYMTDLFSQMQTNSRLQGL